MRWDQEKLRLSEEIWTGGNRPERKEETGVRISLTIILIDETQEHIPLFHFYLRRPVQKLNGNIFNYSLIYLFVYSLIYLLIYSFENYHLFFFPGDWFRHFADRHEIPQPIPHPRRRNDDAAMRIFEFLDTARVGNAPTIRSTCPRCSWKCLEKLSAPER